MIYKIKKIHLLAEQTKIIFMEMRFIYKILVRISLIMLHRDLLVGN